MINNQIKDLKSFDLSYDKIRDEVNKNIKLQSGEVIVRRYNLVFFIKSFTYTIVICLITVLSTLFINNVIINNTNSANSLPGSIYPGKYDEKDLKKQFDEFVAFGSRLLNTHYTINLLLRTNLITDNAKEELKDFLTNNNISDSYCNVYLGIKDNTDIVSICTLTEPYETFVFTSNLDYSFKDIIIDFEMFCGHKLSQEYLLGRCLDELILEETRGILVGFTNVDGLYVAYYQATIDGKTYTVNK